MKKQDYLDALAMLAGAEQRNSAAMIEMVVATMLRKLHPPARGDDVVEVSLSPADLEETVRLFHYEARYVESTETEDSKMVVFLTPLAHAQE